MRKEMLVDDCRLMSFETREIVSIRKRIQLHDSQASSLPPDSLYSYAARSRYDNNRSIQGFENSRFSH
jgi:hypothetical protein